MGQKPTTDTSSATPPVADTIVLPQRGVAGVFGGIAAGCASGGLAWAALILGHQFPILMGFILVVPLPIFLAGLGIGRIDALVAAFVAIASSTYLVNVQMAAVLAIVYIIPALLLSLCALRHRHDSQNVLYWYPAGRLVTALALYPVIVLGGVAIAFSDMGLEKYLHDLLLPAADKLIHIPEVLQKIETHDIPQMTDKFAFVLAKIMPVMLILPWFSMIIVSALWAQFTLMSNNLQLRPIPHLKDFDLPHWLLLLFAIMVLLAMFFEGQIAFYARNTLLPFSVPYFVLGTSLVHQWASQKKHKTMLLIGYYCLICTFYPIIFVALAGVMEPWLHLRQRITGTPKQTI
jgi:hypothetical protein